MQKTYSNMHVPVLPNEVIEAFAPLQSGKAIILDATLGGGGHTSLLLQKYPNIQILGIDQDARTIEKTKADLSTRFPNDTRMCLQQGEFSTFFSDLGKLPNDFKSPWQGVLLDLGYSSNQLESSEYGLSFQIDGPLDMQLHTNSATGMTAWKLLNETSDEELADIFWAYGDIKESRKMARLIHSAIRREEIKNYTKSLADFIYSKFAHSNKKDIHPATLAFQALRIAVNDELRKLDSFLKQIPDFLSDKAIIQIISFHSIEDRLVKNWGKENNRLKALTKKPVMASEAEVESNPRSRSAKLRVYEFNK